MVIPIKMSFESIWSGSSRAATHANDPSVANPHIAISNRVLARRLICP
jgi:hypothetical protein